MKVSFGILIAIIIMSLSDMFDVLRIADCSRRTLWSARSLPPSQAASLERMGMASSNFFARLLCATHSYSSIS